MSSSSQSNWDSVKRYKLNKMINKLGNVTGHGTELVTVYIPPKDQSMMLWLNLKTSAGIKH
jgi:peptide chain release factor subunit 1